jgi:hypothetical protein
MDEDAWHEEVKEEEGFDDCNSDALESKYEDEESPSL